MNLGLVAVFSHHWLNRQTRGLRLAISAAFTDAGIDRDALLRRLNEAAFTKSTFFGRTAVIVDHDRHAFNGGKFSTEIRNVVSMANRGNRIKGDAFVALGFRRRDDHLSNTFECKPPCESRNLKTTWWGLTSGHRHCSVVEELVGHIEIGRDRCSNGERARVEEGSIAQVLHEVSLAHEWSSTNPLRAFSTHLGETNVMATSFVLERHHDVATNANADEFVRPRHC